MIMGVFLVFVALWVHSETSSFDECTTDNTTALSRAPSLMQDPTSKLGSSLVNRVRLECQGEDSFFFVRPNVAECKALVPT